MSLHPDFKPCTWRGSTNTDGECVGISFDAEDGSVIRIVLSIKSAVSVCETIQGILNAHFVRISSQSSSSVGNSCVDGSPQEGQKV